ncbi:hypothetical protein SCP_0901830 [Sparassis crispa]|uniref:Uncharacterized protein n=1 Tax=Sparassis crispa TaxID=139825 RepID=A0A401GX12_9APHY|nr:hypothetical protein SCP_0901830 [Sparassis crispa]GBE86304.1 hypothetical protein SCP_0901830 [Sparassis crispa]
MTLAIGLVLQFIAEHNDPQTVALGLDDTLVLQLRRLCWLFAQQIRAYMKTAYAEGGLTADEFSAYSVMTGLVEEPVIVEHRMVCMLRKQMDKASRWIEQGQPHRCKRIRHSVRDVVVMLSADATLNDVNEYLTDDYMRHYREKVESSPVRTAEAALLIFQQLIKTTSAPADSQAATADSTAMQPQASSQLQRR